MSSMHTPVRLNISVQSPGPNLEPIRKAVQVASLCRLYRRIGMRRLRFPDMLLAVTNMAGHILTSGYTLCCYCQRWLWGRGVACPYS